MRRLAVFAVGGAMGLHGSITAIGIYNALQARFPGGHLCSSSTHSPLHCPLSLHPLLACLICNDSTRFLCGCICRNSVQPYIVSHRLVRTATLLLPLPLQRCYCPRLPLPPASDNSSSASAIACSCPCYSLLCHCHCLLYHHHSLQLLPLCMRKHLGTHS